MIGNVVPLRWICIAIAICFLLGTGACDEDTSIEAPPDTDNPFATAEISLGSWVWLPVAESVCRDGSATGLGVRLQENAGGVLLYLQGGGACYDQQSCAENSAGDLAGENYPLAAFTNWLAVLGNQGVFNTSRAENPLQNWHHVYIPYCSGDLHAGQSPNTALDGLADLQQFMGYQNLGQFLALLGPYFADMDNIVLAGASAGGFGVLLNYDQVAATFAPTIVNAFVDAAPIIVDPAVDRSCFEAKVIDTFNLHLPENCGDCENYEQGGLVNLFSALAAAHPDAEFALASANADIFGVVLLNRESTSCGGGEVNIFNYRAGLDRLRDQELIPAGNWSTFFWSGIQHTCTQSDALYFDALTQGSAIAAWFAQVLAGNVVQIAP